jgi:hypothetical protein
MAGSTRHRLEKINHRQMARRAASPAAPASGGSACESTRFNQTGRSRMRHEKHSPTFSGPKWPFRNSVDDSMTASLGLGGRTPTYPQVFVLKRFIFMRIFSAKAALLACNRSVNTKWTRTMP